MLFVLAFFGFEVKTSLYCVINLVTSAFSSHDSLSLIWISESVDLELSSGATLMTISSVGWIKPMEVRDFSVISDWVTLSTVIWNCPLMLGITRDRVAYRPGILGPIFGSKSPGNKELFVEDLTRRTVSERGGIVTFSHNLTLAVFDDKPDNESFPN